MSVIHNDLLLATDEDTGYNLTKSLRFRSSASASLSRTPASAGNRKTWTLSAWVKRGTLTTASLFTTYTNTDNSVGVFFSGDTLEVSFYETSRIGWVVSNAVYRDPAAWYHLVVSVDTTQATASNRIKAYINGSQITSLSQGVYPNQNADLLINSTNQHLLGKQNYPGYPHYFDGYMADVRFIDGQALTPNSFGTFNSYGVWQPINYTGTYGTNGFYLPFTDIATTSGSNAGLGKDFSGNGNYWTTNNISVTSGTTYDSMTDVPTLTDETSSNYCVINAVNTGAVSGWTSSDGNLKWSPTTLNNWSYCLGTFGVSSGKWYWEGTMALAGEAMFGITLSTTIPIFNTPGGYSSSSYAYYNGNGQKFTNSTGSAYGATWTNTDVIGIAFDADAGSLTFYKNNVSQGVAFSSLPAGTYSPQNACTTNGVSGQAVIMNFGQRPFAYTPPTGYVALNTYNLPDSTIVAGNTVMDATTYTGNGSTQTITNAGGFKPDFVWIKDRVSGTTYHQLQDSVRGATKQLFSNGTDAEDTNATKVTSFDTTGFSLGNSGGVNANGNAFVGWQWQAGQGTTSSNTDGSITSTVSVNASAGFSIVSWTANGSVSTVGHGLGVKPSLIITKQRSTSGDWAVLTDILTGTPQYLYLNSTQAINNTGWGTNPTSSVFSGYSYPSGQTIISYCWAEVAGFSKFGSYTGTGADDGPFVYLGFRPKWVMFKRTDTGATNWNMIDSSRDQYNPEKQYMSANTTNAEGSDVIFDFVSNGFKVRENWTDTNASGGTYIYMAFAENPFKNSLAR